MIQGSEIRIPHQRTIKHGNRVVELSGSVNASPIRADRNLTSSPDTGQGHRIRIQCLKRGPAGPATRTTSFRAGWHPLRRQTDLPLRLASNRSVSSGRSPPLKSLGPELLDQNLVAEFLPGNDQGLTGRLAAAQRPDGFDRYIEQTGRIVGGDRIESIGADLRRARRYRSGGLTGNRRICAAERTVTATSALAPDASVARSHNRVPSR